MLVKHKEGSKVIYVNLDNVSQFETLHENSIRFLFNDQSNEEFYFVSKEVRDEAIERIADGVRWQRMMCDLTV